MGNVGVGRAFKGIGKGLIGTPGRLWDAMEKGDYYQIGAEELNFYMMGRSAAEMTNIYNWGVRGLGLLGKRGHQQWRFQIREGQVAGGMEAAANKVLQQAGERPVEFAYGGVDEAAFGAVEPGNLIPQIYESAFTPYPWEVLVSAKVGGTLGQSALGTLRYHLSSVLRGNFTLRTMVHEGWNCASAIWPPRGTRRRRT